MEQNYLVSCSKAGEWMETKRDEREDEVLTVPEAARFLRVCQHTVRNAYNRGELKGFRIGSRYLFYKRDLKELAKLNPRG